MTRATCKKRRYYDYDEPRGLLPRPKRSSAIPPISQNGARGWWVGGEWIEERPAPSLKREYRTRVSPVVISDDEDSDCLEVLPPIAQNANASRASPGTHFDFNDCQQTLPWAKTPNERSCRAARSFVEAADDELLSYLDNRSISRRFLEEIDHLLRDHPEIADYPEGRDTITQLNSLSPLGAYKYFLRGYTRPARYIDGIVKSEHFTMPPNYLYQPLRTKVDPELIDFFDGFEYRWDIIDRIDQVVREGIREILLGRPLPSGYRRLVCYAVWGNPSDAYKWYEYQLQDEYLPHRYLPEHVILGHLPKLAGDAVPQPSSLEHCRRHKDVRYRMAKANDEGIDVLEVLLTEFKTALIRRGFRRVEIKTMYERARNRLENERQYPTGVDIVDFIMDEIPAQRPTRRIYGKNRQYTRPIPNHFDIHPASSRSSRRKKNNKGRVQKVPRALRTQAAELRSARADLERASFQEQTLINVASRCIDVSMNFPQVTAARARAERRYVNCIVRYSRNTDQMSGVQARELQANFTRRKMQASGVNNTSYLLEMYPQEFR